MSTAPPSFGRVLSAQARLRPDSPGARDPERAMTFRQWNARARRLARRRRGDSLSR